MPFYPPVSTGDNPNPAGYQKRYAYDGDGNIIYEGWGLPGKADTDPDWAIVKNTFDAGKLTLSQWANGNSELINVWTDRTTLTYQ